MTSVKKLGFLSAFVIPTLVIAGFYLGGYWNYLAIVFAFIILPIIDQSSGLDTTNVEPERAKIISQEFYFQFVTYLWTFIQLVFLLWGFYAVSSGKINTLYEWTGFTISFALVTGGIGITVAHELGHKKSKVERLYSKLLLMTVCYMHFYIEHNQGHHTQVATPHDPATARKNENFYAFWFRSVFMGYAHAWQLEATRLNRKELTTFHWKNRMIGFAVLPVIFCLAFTMLASYMLKRPAYEIPLFFFAQSIIAFTFLELVNYVEHYGIERKAIAPNRYERVNPLHSWNASHRISNFFLFQLQRHSDHHANAIKRYQVLNHYDESPQLPFGYPTMILIALLPPLWFSMMNQRLETWRLKTLSAFS